MNIRAKTDGPPNYSAMWLGGVGQHVYIDRLDGKGYGFGPFTDEVEAAVAMDESSVMSDATHKLVWREPAAGCDTCGGITARFRGICEAMDTAEGIQRCDLCQAHPGDLEAAAALAVRIPDAVVVYIAGYGPDEQPRPVSGGDEDYGPFEDAIWHGEDPHGETVAWVASGTNPWVEVDGDAVDWMTFRFPEEGQVK